MNAILSALLGLAAVSSLAVTPLHAQEVGAPKVMVGDRWTYKATNENPKAFRQSVFDSTVDRVGSAGIALSNKLADSQLPPNQVLVGSDWSIWRSVDGKRTMVSQPFNFPLNPNKSWSVEYSEDHPNPQFLNMHIKEDFTVVGWEDVTVAAGTFHALKIEANGTWNGMHAAGTASANTNSGNPGNTVSVQANVSHEAKAYSGVLYKAIWYAPNVKRAVKTVEENYDPAGKRASRVLIELQSYKLADASGAAETKAPESKAPDAATPVTPAAPPAAH